jgi:hypothetical protein
MNLSRRLTIATIGGTALSSLLFMLARSSKAEWPWRMQLPGAFASLATFGVHGGGRFEFDGLMILVNALTYAIALLLILSIPFLRSKLASNG